jgi:hypothetical protein
MKKNRSVKKPAGKPAAKSVSKPSAKGHSVRIPIVIGDLHEFADSTIGLAGTLVSNRETCITDGVKLCLIRHSDALAADAPDVAFGIEQADVAGIVREARRRKGWSEYGMEAITLEVPVGRTAAFAPELGKLPGERLPSARLVDKKPAPYQQTIEQSVTSGTMPVKISVRNLRALVDLLERCAVSEAEIMLCKQDRSSAEFDALMLNGRSLSPAIANVLAICMGIKS